MSINLPRSSRSDGGGASDQQKFQCNAAATIAEKRDDGDSWMSLLDTVIRQMGRPRFLNANDCGWQIPSHSTSHSCYFSLASSKTKIVGYQFTSFKSPADGGARWPFDGLNAPDKRSTPESHSAQIAEAEAALLPQQKSLANCLQDGRVPGCVWFTWRLLAEDGYITAHPPSLPSLLFSLFLFPEQYAQHFPGYAAWGSSLLSHFPAAQVFPLARETV